VTPKQGDTVRGEWTRNSRKYDVIGHYDHTDPLDGIWITDAEIDNGTIIRRVPTYRIPATRQATITILEEA
jgi:hypothetical protein